MNEINKTTSLKSRISQNVVSSFTEIIVESLAGIFIGIEKGGKKVKYFFNHLFNPAYGNSEKKLSREKNAVKEVKR